MEEALLEESKRASHLVFSMVAGEGFEPSTFGL
jgi:hypothetical protein